ncbi:MAG: hypothetical protein ACE5G3_10680 [Gammaproteobacteria bacterium]
MQAVTLGFKAYDAHELACHFVARHAGLYERRGLRVRLVDTTFVPDAELPPCTFQAACAAALTGWLGGADMRVVFVAADRPMFWLHAGAGLRLTDLEGRRVAGYPAPAPPALMFREILRGRGVDPNSVVLQPARDDIARLGLLADGSVDAALVSSAVSPRSKTIRGAGEVLCFGDEIRVPATGLAVSATTADTESGLVTAMCVCYREALELIHAGTGVLEAALSAFVTPAAADTGALAERVRHCYTRDGTSSSATLDAAASLMARAMHATDLRPVDSLYDFSALDAI